MRLFVYAHPKARHALAVLEVTNVTKAKATIAGGTSLEHIKPGMACCPGEGRKADRTQTYVVKEVSKSALVFETTATPQPVEESPKAASEEAAS